MKSTNGPLKEYLLKKCSESMLSHEETEEISIFRYDIPNTQFRRTIQYWKETSLLMLSTSSITLYGNKDSYTKCVEYLSRINEYLQIGSVEITPDRFEIRIKMGQVLDLSTNFGSILDYLIITQDSVFPKIIEGIQSVIQCDRNPVELAQTFIRPNLFANDADRDMKVTGDEKLTTRWFWSKSQQRHTDRIKEIHSKLSNRINNSPPQALKTVKSRSSYYESSMQTEIHKKNIKLLSILTDISAGRRLTSTHAIIDSAKNLPKPKSLNYQHRKQESQRIISDNEAIAKRLMKTTNSLSFKKLDQEYFNVVKYKKTISKAKFRALPKINAKEKNETSRQVNYNQKRAQSMHDVPLLALYTRENKTNLSISPILKSPEPELVSIEPKLEENFLLKGKNFVSKAKEIQNFKPNRNTKLQAIKKIPKQ